jgi:hypothetical protein
MDVNKITECMALMNTVGRMRQVEQDLREAKNAYMIEIRVNGYYFNKSKGDAFVIKKMIEAGITAAFSIRAQAENDLEKL